MGMEAEPRRGEESRVGRPLPADRLDAPAQAGVSRADAWALGFRMQRILCRRPLDSRLRWNDVREARTYMFSDPGFPPARE